MSKSRELNIGIIGEHLVLADLMLHGYDAFATAQGMNYDVVLDLGGRLIKLQVKTTQKFRLIKQRSNPIYFFHLRRHGKSGYKFYKKGDFDGYALVVLDKKLVFYIAFNDCKSNSVCVRDKAIDYSGNRGGGRPSELYYQELTLERFLKRIQ